jgi:hypothetical protein
MVHLRKQERPESARIRAFLQVPVNDRFGRMSPSPSRIRKEWRLQVPQFIIRRDQTSRLGAGPLLKSSFITILVAMRVLPAKMCLLAYAILKERSGMEFDARGKRRRETFLLHPFCHERRLAPFGCP